MTDAPQVRHFRQILMWPLQLMPGDKGGQILRHWDMLAASPEGAVWHEVDDEFPADPSHFQMRHYGEFITFLPFVQRFLYGEGEDGCASPLRVFRRRDVSGARVQLQAGQEPVHLSVAHVDLYFFYDIDVVILVIELAADDLELETAQDLLHRLGRSYPDSWNHRGEPGNCPHRVEWLNAEDQVLAVSDYHDSGKFLSFVGRYRAPAIAAHLEFLLRPLALFHGGAGPILYRQLEYDRLPHLAFLACDSPERLTRGDFVRLALSTRPGPSDILPLSEAWLADFERQYCLDRHWSPQAGTAWDNARFLCTGHSFVVVGDAAKPFVTDGETGLLAQFRHQYFVLGLINHFHKAALLMLSDRLASAVNRLDIRDARSVKRFKRVIRQTFEIFLRFTHRYWFQEVSIQALPKAAYDMWRRHLGLDSYFDEVRREVQDMAQYLDSDGLRRQANTVVRLTVVTAIGLVGTLTTGILGMNLFDLAQEPGGTRLWIFGLMVVVSLLVILASVMVSKRLADMLEVLSDQRMSLTRRAGSALRILLGRG